MGTPGKEHWEGRDWTHLTVLGQLSRVTLKGASRLFDRKVGARSR